MTPIALGLLKPTVSGMLPKPASATTDPTPVVSAVVRDHTTNVQKTNIKLYVNGSMIPAASYSYDASTDKLVYNSPKLARGKRTVKILATDAAGNTYAASWYFKVR